MAGEKQIWKVIRSWIPPLSFEMNFPKEFPEFSKEGINLRRLVSEDADDLYGMRTHDQMFPFLFNYKKESPEEVMAKIDQGNEAFENGKGINWTICREKDPKMIGYVGYWRIVPDHEQAEIGYMIHPDHWGKGIMSKCLDLVFDFAFRDLEIHRIEAFTRKENAASKRLLEKREFLLEGELKDYIKSPSGFSNALIYARLNKSKV